MKRVRNRCLRKLKTLGLGLYRRKEEKERESTSVHSPLCDLPLELVEQVVSSLQLADLRALRMTCKTLYGKASSVFWKISLQTIKTDLSRVNLGELETISRDAQLRRYVKHLVFTGFDESLEILGEGYSWLSHRHQSGHLVNLQDHPAIQRLGDILCQLVNCKSFEICSIITMDRDQSEDDNFRPTDSITTLLDITTRTHLPITTLVVKFMDGDNYAPDPRQLQASDKEQFVAIGQHLEELDLTCIFYYDKVRDWTFHMLLHTPNLRILHLRGIGLDGGTELVHRLASAGLPRGLDCRNFIWNSSQHQLRI